MNTLPLVTTDGTATLWLPQRGTAMLGAMTCHNAAAAKALIHQALQQARGAGCKGLIGPMNGSTWKTYRAVVASDGTPPFFLEPQTPDFLPEAFHSLGCQEVAHYVSSRVPAGAVGRGQGMAQRLQRAGIRLRPFNTQQAEAELLLLHGVSLVAFARNPYYTPIPAEEFLALYQPLLPHLLPEWIWLAQDGDGQVRGFLFALPDLAQGSSPDQLIVKTYASLYPGLGGYLLEQVHGQAAQRGYKTIIHALMHEDNISRNNSSKYGLPFRRYALFGQEWGA